MKKFLNPEGMNDLLLDDCIYKNHIDEKLQEQLALCGFGKIEMPVLEYLDVFSKETCPVDIDDMMKLIDRDGKITVLRPDMTVPAARVAATRFKDMPMPIKLYYAGNVYRSNKRSGRREFYQVGGEIYGDNSIWTDTEILHSICSSLKNIGLKEFTIDLGHVDIIDGICEEAGLTKEQESILKTAIDNKNMVEIEEYISDLEIDEKYKQVLAKVPFIFGRPEQITEDIELLKISPRAEAAVNYLFQVFEYLKEAGYGEYINFDIAMTGGLKYYTGIIFKGYGVGSGALITSGGRYDSLLSGFGVNCAATGFGIFIDSLKNALVKQNYVVEKPVKILAVYDQVGLIDAYKYAEKHRSKGTVVALVSKTAVNDINEYADFHDFDKIVFLDIEKGDE